MVRGKPALPKLEELPPWETDIQELLYRFGDAVSQGKPISFKTFKDVWQGMRFPFVFETRKYQMSKEDFIQALFASALDCLEVELHPRRSRFQQIVSTPVGEPSTLSDVPNEFHPPPPRGGSPLRGAQASADGARPATTGMPLEFNHTLSLADLEFREPRGVWEPAEGAVPATAEMPPEACLAISGEEQAVRPSVTLPTLSLAELAATDSEAESDDETPFPSRSSGGQDGLMTDRSMDEAALGFPGIPSELLNPTDTTDKSYRPEPAIMGRSQDPDNWIPAEKSYNEFVIKVGSVYALYALYNAQPMRLPVRIYLPLHFLRYLIQLAGLLPGVAAVLKKLHAKNAFVVGAVRRPISGTKCARLAGQGVKTHIRADREEQARMLEQGFAHLRNSVGHWSYLQHIQLQCNTYRSCQDKLWSSKGKNVQGLFNTETGNKLAATAKKMQSQVVNLWRQDNCFQTLPGQPLFEEEKAEAVAVAVAGAPRQIESPQAGAASSSRLPEPSGAPISRDEQRELRRLRNEAAASHGEMPSLFGDDPRLGSSVTGDDMPQQSESEVAQTFKLPRGVIIVNERQRLERQEQQQRLDIWNEAIQDLLHVEADSKAAEPSTTAQAAGLRHESGCAKSIEATGGKFPSGGGQRMPAVAGKASSQRAAVAAQAGSGKPFEDKAQAAHPSLEEEAALNGTALPSQPAYKASGMLAEIAGQANSREPSADSPKQQNGHRTGSSQENDSAVAHVKQKEEAREALAQICQEEFLAQNRPAKRTRLKAAEEEQKSSKRQRSTQLYLCDAGVEHENGLLTNGIAEEGSQKPSQQNGGMASAHADEGKRNEYANRLKPQETAASASLQVCEPLVASTKTVEAKDTADSLDDLIAEADDLLNQI